MTSPTCPESATADRRVPFAKAHGLGNDFLLVRADDVAGVDPGELARRMCDRHTGAGADGLVLLGASPVPSAAEGTVADATFRIFNSDGSEAGLSGNALRCAGAWLLGRACLEGSRGKGTQERIVLETKVGPREQFFVRREGNAWILSAEIGKPSFAASSVPFYPPKPPAEPIVGYALPVGDATIAVTVLSMGNPQCILFADEWEVLDWMALGAEIERHPFFPDRTNVGFVRVLAPDRIEARFWERGAGHTLASGTGSCACAVAAHLNSKTGRRVTVEVALGCLEVNWRDDQMVELTGPAEITVEGSFLWEPSATGKPAPPSALRGSGPAGGATG